MAAYHVVWECVVEQWLGVRHTVTGIVAAYAATIPVTSYKDM